MRSVLRQAAFWLGAAVSLLVAACAGGGAPSTNPPPSKTTPAITIAPSSPNITTAQAFTVTVAVSGIPAPTGTVTLSSGAYTSAAAPLNNGSASISVPAGSLATGNDTLTARYTPDAAGSSIYNSSTGTGSVMVTAPSTIIPAVTVTPSSPSVTTAQDLTVTINVSGGNGNPVPTGAVTLTIGANTSAPTTLGNGSASIDLPAGSLAIGNHTLVAGYTPDNASSSTYASASGTASITVTASATPYVLTVNSAAPSSGVFIGVSPTDNNGATGGATSFTRTYNSGTEVTLSAPISFGSYTLVSWTGCTSNPNASMCVVTLNANATVTATYNGPEIDSITVSPNIATIGTQVQFMATVTGLGNFSKLVSWSVVAPSGSNLSPGNISSTGLYTTPYPSPPTVTVKATSTQDATKSGSATVTLSQPSAVTGPSLTVDVANQTHAISPYIYGMNGYFLDQASATAAHPSLVRWGGDDISRYNYKTNTTNSASDYYFENFTGAANMLGGGNFTGLITTDSSIGAATLGTVPVLGWVANNITGACSFTQASYPGQTSYNGNCGSGIYPAGTAGCTNSSGCDIFGNNLIAAITSLPEAPPDITANSTPAPGSVAPPAWAYSTWAGAWVNSILSTYGPANPLTGVGKGVAIWDLDNEPTWWSAVHRDVHPIPFTYDEVTNGGLGTALAIKTADPTAMVSGPVIDNWWAYFYSMKDIDNGYNSGPCYQPWSGPIDRQAHGGVPLIEYYLKQFNDYSQRYGIRLLDYVDIHGYFAPTYSGNSVAFTTAGNTGEQQARMNGTRVFWDPTYTDSNFPQPNYLTDPNYISTCSLPPQAPELITMLKKWVEIDYPGTKTAIDEYNFGGLESINGAVTQADILGIFGREGLDLGAFWPASAYNTQGPGNMAFAIYRNYDGNNSEFGDTALASTSINSSNTDGEGQLAVYGALRSLDGAVTVVVINKTYRDMTSTLSLASFASSSFTAQTYLYSNANLNAIVSQPDVAVVAPASGSTNSTITTKFPAQSITLLVVPR